MQGSLTVQILWVGLGGFVGSVARFLVQTVAHRWTPEFPLGTAIVNVIGCLAIGMVWGAIEPRVGEFGTTRLLWMSGVLGGFTTFSALSLDTLLLVQRGQVGLAALNVVAQIALGFGGAALGYAMMR